MLETPSIVKSTIPDESWDEDDLLSYTMDGFTGYLDNHEVVTGLCRKLAITMFRAGRAIQLLRDLYPNRYLNKLAKHGIKRQWATHARLLFEKAQTEDQIEGLTVTQALRKYGIIAPAKQKRKYPDISADLEDLEEAEEDEAEAEIELDEQLEEEEHEPDLIVPILPVPDPIESNQTAIESLGQAAMQLELIQIDELSLTQEQYLLVVDYYQRISSTKSRLFRKVLKWLKQLEEHCKQTA